MRTQILSHLWILLFLAISLPIDAQAGPTERQKSGLSQETCMVTGVMELANDTVIHCSGSLIVEAGASIELNGYSLRILAAEGLILPVESTGGLRVSNSRAQLNQHLEIMTFGTAYGYLQLTSVKTETFAVSFDFGTAYAFGQKIEGISSAQVQTWLDGEQVE